MFITTSKWPEVSEFEKDSAAESIISIVQGTVGALRNFKQTLNLPLKMEFNLTLKVFVLIMLWLLYYH